MREKHIVSCSALLMCVFCMLADDALAVVRVGNKSRTYADAYNQVNNQKNAAAAVSVNTGRSYGAEYVPASSGTTDDFSELPIRVANPVLANQILRGDAAANVGRSDLTRCAAIYPNGEFEWSVPTVGSQQGMSATCVAVVEMIALGAATDGSDLVVARANVASGDSAKCNISSFPEAGYTDAVGQVIFPADASPTVDDVIAVMNAEQKQNAGFKIAASAVVGALGGNMVGKGAIGNDSLFGTNQEKMQSTAVGALAGAAIGAASTYSGKVAGDTIMSTSVNAAAAGIMGNVMASGDSVLRVENCTAAGESDGHVTCLLGYVQKTPDVSSDDNKTFYYDKNTNAQYKCEADKTYKTRKCTPVTLIDMKLECRQEYKDFEAARKAQFANCETYKAVMSGLDPIDQDSEGAWIKVTSAKDGSGKKEAAIIEFEKDKTFGWSTDDWNKYKSEHASKTIYRNMGNGKIGDAFDRTEYTLKDNFFPLYRGVDDGGIVDLSNPARMKSTLTGAGVGGALGAFSGYQGAQSDIQDRFVAAAREYNDSLGKVVCMTGKRFLAKYNDVITIPEMSSVSAQQNQ